MVIDREKGGSGVPSPPKKELGWEGGESSWTIPNKASLVTHCIFITLTEQGQTFLSLDSNTAVN